jgi:chromosome segregation ATPase
MSSERQRVLGAEVACQTSGPSFQELQDENARLRREVEDLTARAEERSSESQRKSAEAEETVAGLQKDLEAARALASARDATIKAAVRRLVRSRSELERRVKEASLQKDALRLGSIGVQRTGAILTEASLNPT